MKRLLLALLTMASLCASEADQDIFQPTSYSPPASLTIDAGVGLYGIWDFTGATVLGLPASGGLPVGGTTNQVLAKKSATDYDTQWVTPTGGAGTPAGINMQVQFNDNGVFGASTKFTFNKTSGATQINGDLTVGQFGSYRDLYAQYINVSGAFQGNGAIPTGGGLGQVLAKTDASDYDVGWVTPSTGGTATPGGATTQVQFNDAGAFNGDAGLTYDKAGKILTVGTQIKTTTAFGGIVFNAAGSDGLLNVTTNHEVGLFLGSGVVMDYQGGQLVVTIASNYALGWTASGGANGLPDIALRRNAAGVLEVDNGTAGTFADLKVKNLIASGAVTGNGSVPTGGGTGQVLGKNTATNYDLGWITPPTGSGLPTGGNTGQLLTKKSAANGDAQWSDPKVTTRVIMLTSGSGTYTPSNGGCKALFVECMGAGGGSAGSLGTATPTAAASGGGGGGSYGAKYILGPAVNYTYVIGVGGTAGTATPTAGGNGGDTTFGATTPITGFGGGGSAIPTAGTNTVISGVSGPPNGNPATCNCDLYISGNAGMPGMRYNNAGAASAYGGFGGGSHWGGNVWSSSATNANGVSGVGWGYGAGASGGASINATGRTGATGNDGAIRITEIY